MFSARLNLQALLNGNGTVKSQYPEDSLVGEIDPADLALPRGKAVVVTKEEYSADQGLSPKPQPETGPTVLAPRRKKTAFS